MRRVWISTGKIVLFFVIMAAMVAGAVWSSMTAMNVDKGAKLTPYQEIGLEAAILIAITVAAALVLWFFDRRSVASLGLRMPFAFDDFLTGGVVGGFILALSLAVAWFAGVARYAPDFGAFSWPLLGLSAVTMSIHAASEEILMRGYVMQELMSKFSVATSVVVSSVIFVALHAAALVQDPLSGALGAANIFIASLLMSAAYLKTRSLWLPIGIHAGWNFVQGPLLGINVSGNDLSNHWRFFELIGSKLWTGGEFGLEGSLPGLIGPALGVAMVLLLARASAPATPAAART